MLQVRNNWIYWKYLSEWHSFIPANFILSQNIRIPHEALENEQNFYTNSLHVVKKVNFKKNFPLKLGDWSKSDLGIVVENLKLLQQSLRLTDEETREIFSSLKSDEDRAKKNSVGYWCCQGISSPRDPSEVFQKVRLHLLRDTQKIQSDPDQVETTRILEIGDFLELFRNINVSGGSQRTPLHIAGWSKDEYFCWWKYFNSSGVHSVPRHLSPRCCPPGPAELLPGLAAGRPEERPGQQSTGLHQGGPMVATGPDSDHWKPPGPSGQSSPLGVEDQVRGVADASSLMPSTTISGIQSPHYRLWNEIPGYFLPLTGSL